MSIRYRRAAGLAVSFAALMGPIARAEAPQTASEPAKHAIVQPADVKFGEYDQVIVDDAPQITMYTDEDTEESHGSERPVASSLRAIETSVGGKSQKA